MSTSIGIIILAAGKGTRMKIDTPKSLVPALGQPLLDYVVKASLEFAVSNSLEAEVGVVIGHRKEMLELWWQGHPQRSSLKLACQKEQKGTADALRACFNDWPQFWNHEFTLVACADTPMISAGEFGQLFEEFRGNTDLVGVAATFETMAPKGYGRIEKSGQGFRIIEDKDASEEQKKITEVNSGLYVLKTSHIRAVLNTIKNENKSGEFYLTDLFKEEYAVKAVKFISEIPFLGINTLEQLAQVNGLLQEKKLKALFAEGVMFLSPMTVYIEEAVTIGTGSVVYPGVTILGNSEIGKDVTIESGALIRNSRIRDRVTVLANSYIEDSIIHEEVSVGPMARLRPGSEIGVRAKVGNFVEIKKSRLAPGAKVSHLSYVGDAEIGENTNIGCGFITCNYDGVQKHKTKIGKNTFIGSDCQLVAPIVVGDDAFVAAGSTITRDIPDGGFGISRAQQVTKEGMAKRFLNPKK